MRARTPDGQRFRIRRRWLPWRRRVRLPDGAIDTTPAGDDPISAVIAVVLLVPFLIVCLVVSVELLLLLPFYVIGRILLGRRWHIEVSRRVGLWRWKQVGDEQVMGFAASGERISAIAAEIRNEHRPGMTAVASRGT